MRRGARLLRELRELLADQRGNAVMILGLALFPLMGATGLAIDTVLAYTAENQLQKSLDAAALAAGRTFEDGDVEADARSFFDANFGDADRLVDVSDFDVEMSEDGTRITLTATAVMPTRFMQLFGQDEIRLAARTVIVRQTTGLELALVLDNTGSMVEDNKIGALKSAARDLVSILYGSRETVPDLWVSVVPYIAAVNVGRGNIGFLATSDRARGSATAFSPDVWAGCVLARSGSYDRTDDPPATRRFNSYLYPDIVNGPTAQWRNNWGPGTSPQIRQYAAYDGGVAYWEGYGPNVGCPSPITPLTASRSTIESAIDAMRPWFRGGTIINEGLAWGWRTISPRWRGQWAGAPAGLPLDYGAENMAKVIVLLTDGDNQMLVERYNGSWMSPYSTYVSHTALNVSSTSAAKAELDDRTRTVCDNIKAQGITLYTITFGPAPSTSGRALMRACASRPELSFHSPDGATLRTVFRRIGNQLSNLRIVE